MTLEKKVYSKWAFEEHGNEMAKINQEIYKELKPKIKRCFIDYQTHKPNYTSDDLEQYCCFESAGSGYASMKYHVLSNPHNLSKDELALAMDGGNLCFGYRTESPYDFIIYID